MWVLVLAIDAVTRCGPFFTTLYVHEKAPAAFTVLVTALILTHLVPTLRSIFSATLRPQGRPEDQRCRSSSPTG